MERRRVDLLNKAVPIIKSYFSKKQGVSSVYLTGSILQPGRFSNWSDIDVAVEGLSDADYFGCISDLEEYLGCQVEIIELKLCKFKDKIKKTGLKIL